jgi:hypothetical protein
VTSASLIPQTARAIGAGSHTSSHNKANDPFMVPSSFVVRRWIDPIVEQHGFPAASIYTESVLLPILAGLPELVST